MLLYVQSKSFPHRTFICHVAPTDTIALVRAQLLHILYELGRVGHQFRLRYKGEYLRDAYCIEDYKIIDNAVIKMVSLSRQQSAPDLRSINSSSGLPDQAEAGAGIKQALQQEVEELNKRENFLFHFQGLQYIHFLGFAFAWLTTYWYSGFWSGALWLYATWFCPQYTRQSGFTGGASSFKYKKVFCIAYGLLSLGAMSVSILFSYWEWTKIIAHGCPDWEFVDDCSHTIVFSAVYYAIHAVMLLVCSCIVWFLLTNFRLQIGDYIIQELVKTRDIDKVLQSARQGKIKEKRIAAFELATLAASSDDNKFRIVAEEGLEVLITMSLSKDEATQEHAVEALGSLLTVPAIQDKFVEMGGVRTLSTLLLSPDPRLVEEAATALFYIVSDSEENKIAVVQDHGLDDLSHAARDGTISCQRTIAAIYLELAFNTEIRAQMAAMNTPANALVTLCKSNDSETQGSALQTLELLAIESAEMICAQEELMDLLLCLPLNSMDDKLYLLAGKILLYYAESKDSCEKLLDRDNLKDSLLLYSKTTDPILQKVVAKVIFFMLDDKDLRTRASSVGLVQVVKYLREHAADREVWDMADEAISILNNPDELPGLPGMSTMDKINRMNSRDSLKEKFGSMMLQGNLGSKPSLKGDTASTNSMSGSSAELKKGID